MSPGARLPGGRRLGPLPPPRPIRVGAIGAGAIGTCAIGARAAWRAVLVLACAAQLACGAALAQEAAPGEPPALPEDSPLSDEDLMVDPAFSDNPMAVAPAEPSAAEREAAARAARGPETARGGAARLRGLDKVTGRTQDFELAPGASITFGRLELRLGECRYPAADPSSDAFAELTVIDQRANREVFSGWMIASSPALSALDDPRYDVWVMSCNRA